MDSFNNYNNFASGSGSGSSSNYRPPYSSDPSGSGSGSGQQPLPSFSQYPGGSSSQSQYPGPSQPSQNHYPGNSSLNHYPSPPIASSSNTSRPPPRKPNNMDGLLDDTPVHLPPPTLPSAPAPLTSDPNFDIIDWHPAYQSCQRYFLDHAQHEPGTQALCALINIRLPCQWLSNPVLSSSTPAPSPAQFTFKPPYPGQNGREPAHAQAQSPAFVSLIPYIRRLIITGFDKPPILHGFFGDSYKTGISPHLDCERRNYLFAAKQNGWRSCQEMYASGDETPPFMKPLEDASTEEIAAADKAWSKWEGWQRRENMSPSSRSGVNINGKRRSPNQSR
jgi:hypothetical protein